VFGLRKPDRSLLKVKLIVSFPRRLIFQIYTFLSPLCCGRGQRGKPLQSDSGILNTVNPAGISGCLRQSACLYLVLG
jgi:hypothetical protein